MLTYHAKYTVVLLELMKDPHCNNAIIDALGEYPIYRGKKEYDLIPTREQLNEKILNHYKYREIGFETVGRFIDELRITMNEIMPYYNELFKSVEIMADLENPFDNVDITETFDEERHDESSGVNNVQYIINKENVQTTTATGQATSTGKDTKNNSSNFDEVKERRFQDTPQNNVDDIDNYLTDYTKENVKQDSESSETLNTSNTSSVENESKVTDRAMGTDSSDTEMSGESDGTLKRTVHRKGNHGVNTYAHDMNEFRTSIIDVVDRIIHDKRLAELFMLVW